MCERSPIRLEELVRQASGGMTAPQPDDAMPMILSDQGSRRRKLWELHGHAHCPVIGVCLPMAVLRRLAGKLRAGPSMPGDYELHCSVNGECRQRTQLAEAVQRELDRRYVLALRNAARIKTTESLADWWRETSAGADLAGTLWATLTHPRCTAALEQRVLGDVHMIQHQVGMARRVDVQRFQSLIEESGALKRELAGSQQRFTRHTAEQARRVDAQQAEILRLRAQLIGRDTAIAALHEELEAMRAALTDSKDRARLVRENERLLERSDELQRALIMARQESERLRRRADEQIVADMSHDGDSLPLPESTPGESIACLDDVAVLCVGGRSGSVPVFRQLVERTGGRFMHHDGGDEEHLARLDSTLAAADVVICQTGCISHGAYWRVKDHCKRTGKRCLFVETPSTAALRRALAALTPPLAELPSR